MTAKDPFNIAAKTPEELGDELHDQLGCTKYDTYLDIRKALALIKAGASLEEEDWLGRTALMAAAQNQHTSCVKALIAAKAKLDEKNSLGMTALMLAASGAEDDGSVKALLKAGASFQDKNTSGMTALMYAAESGQLSAVRALIKAGARLDEKNSDGETALMWAAQNHHVSCVKALIAARAKIDEKDERGLTALMWAVDDGDDEDDATVKALVDAKASLDDQTPDFGITALMMAARECPAAVVKVLTDAGASPDIKSHEGKTALVYAEEFAAEFGGDPGDEVYYEEFQKTFRVLKDAEQQRQLRIEQAEAARVQSVHDAIAERQRNLLKLARPVIVKNAMSGGR